MHILSSWYNISAAIPHDDVVANFRYKSKRPKGGKGKEVLEPEVVVNEYEYTSGMLLNIVN